MIRDWEYTENHPNKVFENNEAMVVYHPSKGDYEAIEKELRGCDGYGYYHRSTSGNFQRAKKAFEKYSPNTMKALGIK